MTKNIPWFKFEPIVFMDDENVKMMCDEAIGLYMRILCHSWTHDSIPANHEKIAALFKLSKHKFKKLWPKLEKCFYEKDFRLFNKKLTALKIEAENNFQKKSEIGTNAANIRWQGHSVKHTSGINDAMQDPDRDSDIDPEEEIYKSPVNPYKHIDSPGPKKFDDTTGFRISQIINANREAFDKDSTDTSNNVKKLFVALLTVPELKPQHLKTLGYIIQTRGIINVKDPVAFCIKLIKAPKFAVADVCLQRAKVILNGWYPINKKVEEILPDLRPSD